MSGHLWLLHGYSYWRSKYRKHRALAYEMLRRFANLPPTEVFVYVSAAQRAASEAMCLYLWLLHKMRGPQEQVRDKFDHNPSNF